MSALSRASVYPHTAPTVMNGPPNGRYSMLLPHDTHVNNMVRGGGPLEAAYSPLHASAIHLSSAHNKEPNLKTYNKAESIVSENQVDSHAPVRHALFAGDAVDESGASFTATRIVPLADIRTNNSGRQESHGNQGPEYEAIPSGDKTGLCGALCAAIKNCCTSSPISNLCTYT